MKTLFKQILEALAGKAPAMHLAGEGLGFIPAHPFVNKGYGSIWQEQNNDPIRCASLAGDFT